MSFPGAAYDEFFLDPREVRRSFDRASASYDGAAAVPGEIRARLLERLDFVRLEPRRILDLGAGTGQASRALKQRYRGAEVIALDLSPAMLRQSARHRSLLRRFHRLAADAHRLPLRTASIDLVFSNLMLEWCHNPDAVFADLRRTMAPNALLTFATLGPDTLRELRESWRGLDLHTHVHRFIDMHDLGDALLRAGFAEPVMDVERLTVTFPDVSSLLRELRASGARNVAQGRGRGLMGRARYTALQRQPGLTPRNGVLPVSVEVVYGHAWAGMPRPAKYARGDVRIRVDGLRDGRT